MNRLPAAAHRLSIALIGLVLIAVGVVAICANLGVDAVVEWIGRFDGPAVERFVDSGWWTVVLGGIVIVALVWAITLVVSAVRSNAVDDLTLAGSDETGALTVAPKLIAAAVADELAGDPMFSQVSARALDDRARSIIRFEVTASADRTYPEITARVCEVTDQIREAVAGSGVHVQALVHLDRPRR